MGGCLSCVGGDFSVVSRRPNSAFVILPKGDLRPYSTPIIVSDVLEAESSSSGFFICNSDNLCYDEHIICLDGQEELDAGQIYFILPVSKLRDRLTASEMAALAVKASAALNSKTTTSSSSRSPSSKRKKLLPSTNKSSKISPFVVMETSKINVIVDEEAQNKRPRQQLGVVRSGSIRKMQRYSSRKTRLAVWSFRLRLSTIYERESSSHHR